MERFSIIIPTLNNLQYLLPCITAVDETVNFPYEIIVVANNASTKTVQCVRALGHQVIELSENLGFAKACNIGAAEATGDIFVFLNDDTIPAPKWLERLYLCFKYFGKKSPSSPPLGAVGPTSNYVAGRQHVSFKQSGTDPRDVVKVAEVLSHPQNLPPIPWDLTGFLSGFCLMTPRKVWDLIGGFDEMFFSGCEDNAYCHQVIANGYACAIAFDSYVYHHGSKTLDREEFQYLKRGTTQKADFNKAYRIKGPQTLAVVYRAKIEDEFFADIFDKSLAKAATFADGIFILDDGSPYNIDAIVEKYRAQGKIARYERFTQELGETRDRGLLYRWAEEAGYDWIFSIDSDEVVEDKFNRAYADRLMHPYNPEILSYWVHFYTFWDTFETYRTNDTWGKMAGPRLAKILPASKVGHSKSDFHCGNVPIRPWENTAYTSIRIKHYGYLRAKDRQRKYAWYTKTDPNPDPKLVGHPDYKHLIAEDNIQVARWVEDCSVSLTTIMKNEESLLSDFLFHILSFVDEMCLVDTGSTDRSIEIAEEAGVTVTREDFGNSFSKCRNASLKRATSAWALHMDIDERLENMITIRRLLDIASCDGFVFYVKNFMPTGKYTISETVRLMRKPSTWWYTGYVHETTDDCMAQRQKRIHRSPVFVHHFGYFRPTVPEKFKKYIKLNKKQMHDFPKDARPVFNLAMHYLEDPAYEKAGIELLKKAVILNPRFYSPRKELCIVHLREALADVEILLQLLPSDHVFRKFAEDVTTAITPFAQPVNALAPGHVGEALKDIGELSAGIKEEDSIEATQGPDNGSGQIPDLPTKGSKPTHGRHTASPS